MIQSNFHHSIRFGDGTLENGKFKGYDTYEDWHLIPSSRPTIAPPGVETKFVTIPGMDGSIDLSEFLRKDRPAFGNRAGTFDFYVANMYDDPNIHEYWMSMYPKIVNAIHGKRFKMVLWEDDPDYYWEGRFTVDKHDPGNGDHSSVSISYQVGPYKWKIRPGNDSVTWDNFNFQKDYDNGVETGYVYGDGGVVCVDISNAGADTELTIGEETIPLAGRRTARIIRPVNGKTAISLSGEGSMVWREGSL